MHLKAAQYIEKQFAANLSRFYTSLSYHYSNSEDQEANAFKYTVKAADAIISKGAFKVGLDLLLTAQEMCNTSEEFSVVLKICKRGIKEIRRASAKGSKKTKDKNPVGFPVGFGKMSSSNLNSLNTSLGRDTKDLSKEKESPRAVAKSTSGRLLSMFSSPLKTIHSPRSLQQQQQQEKLQQQMENGSDLSRVPSTADHELPLQNSTSFRRSLLGALSSTFTSLTSPHNSGKTPPTIDPSSTPGKVDGLLSSPMTRMTEMADAGSVVSLDSHLLTQYNNLCEELESDVAIMLEYDAEESGGGGGSGKVIIGATSGKTAAVPTPSQKGPLEAVKEADGGEGGEEGEGGKDPVPAGRGALSGDHHHHHKSAPPQSSALPRFSAAIERTFSFLGRSDSNASITNAHHNKDKDKEHSYNKDKDNIHSNNSSSKKSSSVSINLNVDGRTNKYKVIENLNAADGEDESKDDKKVLEKSQEDQNNLDLNFDLGVSTKNLKVMAKPTGKPSCGATFMRVAGNSRKGAGNAARGFGRRVGACVYYFILCRSNQPGSTRGKKIRRGSVLIGAAHSRDAANSESNGPSGCLGNRRYLRRLFFLYPRQRRNSGSNNSIHNNSVQNNSINNSGSGSYTKKKARFAEPETPAVDEGKKTVPTEESTATKASVRKCSVSSLLCCMQSNAIVVKPAPAPAPAPAHATALAPVDHTESQ
jgi:hypothetical protein